MTTPADTDTAPDNVRSLPGEGQGKLTTPDGEQMPVRTFKRGEDVLLVVLVDSEQPPSDHLASAELEYNSVRGVVRLHGEAWFQDRSLIRFTAQGEPEVKQRRSFVRVTTPQSVTLDSGEEEASRVHTVDLSGGGMLLTGAETLDPEQTVGFTVSLNDDELPIEGQARVVRIREDGKRALVFDQIEEHDRQRLIRFVFDCMRAARARTRGDLL